MRLVEGDDVLQRTDGRRRAGPREVFRQIGLELVEEHIELAVVELAERRNVGWLDDDGPLFLHVGDRGLRESIRGLAVAEELLPHDPDPRALEPVRIEELRVVAQAFPRALFRRRIGRIESDHRAEDGNRVSHCPRHGSGRVLTVGNRHDSGATQEAEGRLDADQRVDARRRHDRSVRFRPDGGRGKAGGRRGARARART